MKPSHLRILDALATYKFLTSSQLVTLRVLSDRNNINREIGFLRKLEKPLMATVCFSVDPKLGKLESFHYLTPFGARLLVDELDYDLEDIKLPSGKVDFSHIYWHHKQCLDIEILARDWVLGTKQEVVLCDRYFDRQKTKGGSRAKSSFTLPTGKVVNPDLVLLWADRTQQLRLILLELHRGHDVAKLVKQLQHHVLLIQHAIPLNDFRSSHGLKRSHRLLIVLEEGNMIKSVRHRLTGYLGEFAKDYDLFFLFASLKDLRLGFDSAWVSLSGDQVSL